MNMLANLISAIEPFVQAYGMVGVFAVAFIEEIFAPIPSILSFMAAGFFLLPETGSVSTILWEAFLKVALPAGLGLTAGAFFVYAAFYFGGEPLIHRWGRYVGISWTDVKQAETRFIRGHADEWILFGLRVVPFVPNVAISVVCGTLRYPLKTYLALTFVGGMIRAFFVGLIGWSVGAAYAAYAEELNKIGYALGLGALLIIAVWVGYLIKKRHSASNPSQK